MRKEFSASRVLSLFVGVLFFLLSASCGGGGGDDEEDIQTLDSYDFNLSFLDDDPVVVASESGSWIRMEGRGEDSQILGSYDVDGNTITLDEDYGVKASTNIFGFVRATLINLDTDIVSVDGDYPRAGAVSLAVEDPDTSEILYTVTLTISTVGSDTTVSLEYFIDSNLQGTADYDWNTFEGLFWNGAADEWQRQASYAWYVLNFHLYQVKFVVETLTLIGEHDTELQSGSVTVNGDRYPPVTGTVGTMVLRCTSGNGGPGSDFSQTFTEYWENDPDDELDSLMDGIINYRGFLETVDEARQVITAIGFWPGGTEDPGGVFFGEEGLTVSETDETSLGTFEETTSYNISGSYAIMFYEHDNG